MNAGCAVADRRLFTSIGYTGIFNLFPSRSSVLYRSYSARIRAYHRLQTLVAKLRKSFFFTRMWLRSITPRQVRYVWILYITNIRNGRVC
jgi:hypothetical protein